MELRFSSMSPTRTVLGPEAAIPANSLTRFGLIKCSPNSGSGGTLYLLWLFDPPGLSYRQSPPGLVQKSPASLRSDGGGESLVGRLISRLFLLIRTMPGMPTPTLKQSSAVPLWRNLISKLRHSTYQVSLLQQDLLITNSEIWRYLHLLDGGQTENVFNLTESELSTR